jgi:hypothetical protein
MMVLALSLIAAQTTLADTTPNPSAVQYRDVREHYGVVCGQINRPNKAGGYEGFDPFAYRGPQDWVIWANAGYLVSTPEGLIDTTENMHVVMQTRATAENSAWLDKLTDQVVRGSARGRALLQECRQVPVR